MLSPQEEKEIEMIHFGSRLVGAAMVAGLVVLVSMGSTQTVRAQSGCYYDYFWSCNDSAQKGATHHARKGNASKTAKTYKHAKKITKTSS